MRISFFKQARKSNKQSIFYNVVCFAVASFFSLSACSATLNLSDLPLSIKNNVPSNLIVTLDDSGSMAWGFMPDSASTRWWSTVYRSSNYNKVYYNPAITYNPPKESTGVSKPNASFTAAIRGYYYGTGNQFTVDLSTSYRTIYYHYSTGGSIFLGANAVAAYNCRTTVCADEAAFYYEFHGDNTINAACDGLDENNGNNIITLDEDEGCYTKVVITAPAQYSGSGGVNGFSRTQAQEETNFANWYQYYSIRADASKSALRLAFVPDVLNGQLVRVGRQTLNNDIVIQSGPPTASVNGISLLEATERKDFYDWIDSVSTAGGTPLRNAVFRSGEYFKTENAYKVNPVTGAGNTISCRANNHILVTDGLYNGGFTTPTGFFLDQNSGPLPDGENYDPATTPIFSNGLDAQSLSDLTFHYWATDLYGDGTDNDVEPVYIKNDDGTDNTDYWNPANDPATWQHMRSFGISFGVAGTISTDDATYQQLLTGTQTWPQSFLDDTTSIDDLYHSSINGRGQYFNAADPNELVEAIGTILASLKSAEATAPAVTSTSQSITADTKIFEAKFDTESWSGKLSAVQLSDGTKYQEGVTPTACNTQKFGSTCNTLWKAEERNEEDDTHMEPSVRRIYSYIDTSTGADPQGSAIDFIWADLSAAQQSLMNNDGLGQARVDYIRGDDSNEADNGGDFRVRNGIKLNDGSLPPSASRVGAIVNSSPVFVGSGRDKNGTKVFNYPDDLESASYDSFIDSAAVKNRKPTVYVGANDGMLHAYAASDGRESFAYIPDKVIENLPDLTAPNFQSGAYVDGPIAVRDIFDGTKWRTVLVGALRTGGQGYYALDITDSTPASAADVVMWEFTDKNDADLGFTFGTPQFAKANNGEWVVIVASGYNSTVSDGQVGTGEAALYVLRAETGELLSKFTVGSPSLTNPNGLSSPVSVSDRDLELFGETASGADPDDFTVDYVYAGDLQGNMWKFDMTSTNPADWDKAYLLFAAGNDQPITAKPDVGTDLSGSNRIVYFGTGQFVEPNDITTVASQDFYGIIDKDNCTSTSSACVSSSSLGSQSISGGGVVTNNLVGSGGWKLLLSGGSAASERTVTPATVVGSLVLFASIVPEGNICAENAATAYLYVIDRFSGGSTVSQVLYIPGNTGANIISRKKISNAGTVPRVFTSSDKQTGDLFIISGGSNEGDSITPGTDEPLGRVRWRRLK